MTTSVAPGQLTRPSRPPMDLGLEGDVFLAAFDAAPVGFYVARADGTVLRANDAFGTLVGKSREGIEGTSLFDLFPADESSLARSAHEQVFAASTAVESEWSFLRGGRRVTVADTSRVHTTAGGVRLRIATVQDVSETRSLRAKERLFSGLMKALPILFYAFDKDGTYVDAAGRALEALGVIPESLVGTNVYDSVRGTEAEGYVRRALSGEEFNTSLVFPNPGGGGDLHYQSFYLPLRDTLGRPDGAIGVSLDVTQERAAEQTLREKLALIERQTESLALLRTILDSAPIVLTRLSNEGIVTLSEGKGLDLLGVKPGEDVGMNALERYQDPGYLESCTRALTGQEVRNTVEPAPDVFFDGWFLPVHGKDGAQDGMTFFGVDATQRMRAEIDLREKLELIERQSATIRALATPIIKVWDEVLCLPVVGTVDSGRTAEMMDALLQAIVKDQARFAVVDLTGVEVVDTSTADHILQLFRAAGVLGVEGILCGIRPAVAQTVVALGVDLTTIRTMRTLQDALRFCLREQRLAAARSESRGKGVRRQRGS